MASAATPMTGRRPPSRATATSTTASTPAAARMTRLRAAKETPTSVNPPQTRPSKPSGLIAKGKEGLRKVSDKIKEKEKDKMQRTTTVVERFHTQSLQAFLRIRPPPMEVVGSPKPYLEPQGDKEVLMRAPMDPHRPHVAPKPPLVYSFDRVFAPPTNQSDFFTQTTLPLVEKLLHGENGLMFAYGVSNSGKSYTISGGNDYEPSERGVLPRSLDVVFNSIKGMDARYNIRCTGMADIEFVAQDETPKLFDRLSSSEACTAEAVKVDKNYSYAVFVSYAEIYNEKIFDLLDNVLPVHEPAVTAASRHKLSTANTRGSSVWAMSGPLNSSMNLAALANGGAGVIRRQALSLKNDPDGNGKYIAGLKEIRVRTREEALAVFRAGQGARQVFGTLANRESSRSHGVFNIKVVKINNGAPTDPESYAVSRLAIVDLAGSERTRNTGTTGDRLKEAGNINKSLMVLGQCMEVLRANQQKLSVPAAPGSRKRLAIVPFRHSKLTEIFQSFFDGDGRAVMVVNVNPYDTGFDENSHVMRFSAIAREVQTTAQNKVTFGSGLLRRQISTQFSALRQAVSGPMKVKVTVPVIPKADSSSETNARSRPTLESQDSYVMVEEELEVVEEDADENTDDERDVLVDHLFEQLRELRERLYESEIRNATVEVEVREEVAKEMQETIQKMHDDFSQRLQDQVNAGDMKIDRKIDILSRTMATPAPEQSKARPIPRGRTYLESTPEIDMESSVDADSEDVSFESAIDESLREGTLSPLSFQPGLSDVTDPFIARSPLHKEFSVDESETEEEVESEERAESDAVSDMDPDDSCIADISHEQIGRGSPLPSKEDYLEAGNVSYATGVTDESEDVLAGMTTEASVVVDDDLSVSHKPTSVPAQLIDPINRVTPVEDDELVGEESDSSSLSVDDAVVNDLTVEEEDEKDEDEDEEEESEDDEEDEEEEVSDSSFAESEADEQSVSSASPSPKRRQSVKKRTTVSPVKAKGASATPARKAMMMKMTKSHSRRSVVDSSPLNETMRQESVDISEDEIMVKAVTPKKKRVLGKKIINEDEMAEDGRGSQADIKRMGARNVLRG